MDLIIELPVLPIIQQGGPSSFALRVPANVKDLERVREALLHVCDELTEAVVRFTPPQGGKEGK